MQVHCHCLQSVPFLAMTENYHHCYFALHLHLLLKELNGSHSWNQYHEVIVASTTALDCAHLVCPTGKLDTNSCHQKNCNKNLRHAEDGPLKLPNSNASSSLPAESMSLSRLMSSYSSVSTVSLTTALPISDSLLKG
jgi:hypothetical protein